MKNLIRLLLFLTLLAAPGFTCPGQVRQEEPAATIVGRPASYRTINKAEISYFDEANFTEVRVELGTVYKGRGHEIGMYTLFKVKGKEITPPEEVMLSVVPSMKRKGEAEALDSFTVEVDGQRISFLTLTKGEIQYALDEKKYMRDLDGRLALSQFERIANGANVKVQVGQTIFQFSYKQREGLRDMLKAIKSPSQ